MCVFSVCPRFYDATEQHWFDVKTLEFIVSPSENSFIESMLSRCGRYVKNLTLLLPPKTTDSLTLDILNMLDVLKPESPINFVEKISEMKNLRRIKVSNIWDRSTDDSTRAINNLPDEMEEISFDITSKGLINFGNSRLVSRRTKKSNIFLQNKSTKIIVDLKKKFFYFKELGKIQ